MTGNTCKARAAAHERNGFESLVPAHERNGFEPLAPAPTDCLLFPFFAPADRAKRNLPPAGTFRKLQNDDFTSLSVHTTTPREFMAIQKPPQYRLSKYWAHIGQIRVISLVALNF